MIRAEKLRCSVTEIPYLPATLIDDLDIIIEAEGLYRKSKEAQNGTGTGDFTPGKR